MNRNIATLCAGLLPAFLLAAAAPADAAESYDNCNRGFVASVPTTLDSQGVYCLNKDLTTNLATGSAISINNNNVTLDCNGFKLGNQLAGVTNVGYGISASGRANITVRNCNVRGYFVAISLTGSGHLVEDNRAEDSGTQSIAVVGDGSVIRRNLLLDTGNGYHTPYGGIYTSGLVDVLDNIITGVYAVSGTNSDVHGIYLDAGNGGRVEGNAVRGLLADTGNAYGIWINNTGGGLSVSRNRLMNAGAASGSGVQCTGLPQSILVDNHMQGFTNGSAGCADAGLNYDQ